MNSPPSCPGTEYGICSQIVYKDAVIQSLHAQVTTHTHTSRYTSEICQQVIIFHTDSSELLSTFQLPSLFKLPFLQLFLTPGAQGQQPRSAFQSCLFLPL
jgi:hypothetical protein